MRTGIFHGFRFDLNARSVSTSPGAVSTSFTAFRVSWSRLKGHGEDESSSFLAAKKAGGNERTVTPNMINNRIENEVE